MKPVDPGAAAPAPAQNAASTEKTDELKAALEQRLWQLLLAAPELRIEGLASVGDVGAQVARVSDVSGTAASSGAQEHRREREQRDKDASSLLTGAAHLLAITIPELGLLRYAGADGSESRLQPSAATSQHNWTVQLGRVDADGGSAAVHVQHPLLGDIALDVELSQGSVRVIATVPTDYGARILLEGQQVLAERLLRQGVTLQVLDVLVRRKRKGKDSQPARKRPRKQDR